MTQKAEIVRIDKCPKGNITLMKRLLFFLDWFFSQADLVARICSGLVFCRFGFPGSSSGRRAFGSGRFILLVGSPGCYFIRFADCPACYTLEDSSSYLTWRFNPFHSTVCMNQPMPGRA